jgi:hypothetical protein
MTDLEKFIELYKSLGVELRQETGKWKDEAEAIHLYLTQFTNEHDINAIGNPLKQFGGYDGFYSVIVFTPNGKFIIQEFLEA